jgi:hypothetical protein
MGGERGRGLAVMSGLLRAGHKTVGGLRELGLILGRVVYGRFGNGMDEGAEQ